MVGLLGDTKYCLVSIRVIEVFGNSPQFTETTVFVFVCVVLFFCPGGDLNLNTH